MTFINKSLQEHQRNIRAFLSLEQWWVTESHFRSQVIIVFTL